MMKFLLLVFALVLSTDSAIVRQTNPSSFSVGYVTYYDRLLYRQYLQKPAIPNAIQHQDLVFRGSKSTRIAAITGGEMGYGQNATAWIISGGVGANNVTVRVQSARGKGYNYVVDIWGR